MGIGALLDITRSALTAQRIGTEVTGHNIANAETEGYSRQTLVLSARAPLQLGSAILGTGVQVDQIQRSYNLFANMNIDRQASSIDDLEVRSGQLSTLETLFNEVGDGTGLGDQLSAFWAGWQDVANNPSGTPERLALLQTAQSLVATLHSQRETLDATATEVRQRIVQEVGNINDTVSQIAMLNNEITGMEASGASANDLRDKRDVLLNQLSSSVGANYFQDTNGQMTVFIGGRLMVQGGQAYSLDAEVTGASTVAIKWHGSLPTTEDISSQIEGGRLGGYLTLLQDTVPTYSGKLDQLAEAIIFEVNSVHSQGVGTQAQATMSATEKATDPGVAMTAAGSGLHFGDRIDDSGTASFKVHAYDSSGTPLVAGGTTITITSGMSLNDLATALDNVAGLSASVSADGVLTVSAASGEGGASFAFSDDTSNVLAALGLNSFFSGQDASTIGVSATVDTINAGKVQADSSFGAGDGSNALAIADIQDKSVNVGGVSETLGTHVGALVGTIGAEAASVGSNLDFKKSVMGQLQDRRDSQTGVSLDEEMTNLMKFQHAYTAAAKLLTTADEMLTTLLELK